MHVGVFGRVGVLDAVQHRLRLLRRGRVVEIDERLAVDLHAEDREILADAVDVIGAIGDRGMHGHARFASQAATCSISVSRRPGVLDAFDRLADKGLDHQRLGLLGGNAARLEVEQQVLVERAGGRAVAALHVVGEDFELGLVVGLGLVREQQRVRRHLGVGLLGVRPHDDLALEDAAALVVEHRLEHLAADAAARLVIGDQRRVRVLAAVEQASRRGCRRPCPRRRTGRTADCAPPRRRW